MKPWMFGGRSQAHSIKVAECEGVENLTLGCGTRGPLKSERPARFELGVVNVKE